MMDEGEFDKLMREAAPAYRVPPAPPLEAMWERIESAHFDTAHSQTPALRLEPVVSPRRALPRWWLQSGLAIAATLLMGIGIGRVTAPRGSALVDVPPVMAADTPVSGSAGNGSGAYDATTTLYLGQAAALLTALPDESRAGRTNRFVVTQASDLLSITRLLIDSPAAADPELRLLLDDMELVLAQIARLPRTRSAAEIDLITEALEHRDVLPRLRSAAASLPYLDS